MDRILIGISILFLWINGLAAALHREDFHELARRADEARRAGSVEQAIGLYQRGVHLNPDWDEGWVHLGMLLYGEERYAEALHAFRRPAASRPDYGPTWAMIGLCEYFLGTYERALLDLQRARHLGLLPSQVPMVRYYTGVLLVRSGQFDAAYTVLGEFAYDSQDDRPVLEALGLAVMRMPLLPEQVSPQLRPIVLQAGEIAFLVLSNRAIEAEERFKDLVETHPNNPAVRYFYGAYLVQQHPDEGLRQLRETIRLDPSHGEAHIQIALEHLRRGEHSEAVGFAQKGSRLLPESFFAYNTLGRALLETDRVSEAIEVLEKGAQLVPESSEIRFTLARAYARAGREEEAAREREEFLRLDRLYRSEREGPQSVGGRLPPTEPPPD